MGLLKWFKKTSLNDDVLLYPDDLSVEDIASRVMANERFSFSVEISDYAELYQACYERLMKQCGDGAPILGAWTSAGFNCDNCNRPFPSSFKLHLTMPLMFDGLQPRWDCPDCGGRFARIAYEPPPQ